jgi:hypothetical protein
VELRETVPWGRSFDEYVRMFALSERDLGLSIVGCGDGPAAFNAEMTRRGNHIVWVDPLYRFSATEIAARVREIADEVVEGSDAKRTRFFGRIFVRRKTWVGGGSMSCSSFSPTTRRATRPSWFACRTNFSAAETTC